MSPTVLTTHARLQKLQSNSRAKKMRYNVPPVPTVHTVIIEMVMSVFIECNTCLTVLQASTYSALQL